MKAVIIGAGAAGMLHALAYRAHGVAIAGVFDPDLARASDLVGVCGGRVVETAEELSLLDADIASVCSPPRVHVEQAELLARVASRTVLVEKPVATTTAELDRLLVLPRCVPVLQWRAGRAIRAVRRAIARGELGDAPVASCDLAWGRDDEYVRARDGTWGCGATLSIGIHAIDALLWSLGRDVNDVSGFTARSREARQETAAVGTITFEGGALASIRMSIDGGADSTRLTFCGGGVTAIIAGGEADPTGTRVQWFANDEARGRLDALERDTDGALGPPLLVPYIGDVVTALREGRSPGETRRLPAISDVYVAHVTAMKLAGGASAPDPEWSRGDCGCRTASRCAGSSRCRESLVPPG